MNKFHQIRSIVFFLIFGGVINISFSQEISFSGGNGRGDATTGTGQVFLSGGTYSPPFGGGSGKGDTKTQTLMLTMGGVIWTPTYAGGNGRGDQLGKSILIFLNGEDVELKYRGGAGNGNSVANSGNMLLNGGAISQVYPGGNGQGSSQSKSGEILLNGSGYFVTFRGGSGRGDKSLKTSKINLNGTIVPLARVAVSHSVSDFFLISNGSSEVSLRWKGNPDPYVSHYLIEKNEGAADYEQIGLIDRDNHQHNQYFFQSEINPKIPIHFRIKTVLVDGETQVSEAKSISFEEGVSGLSISPNPASDFVMLKFPNSDWNIPQILILNIHGKEVQPWLGTRNQELILNVSQLDPGVYWVIAKSSSKILREKLVVQ